MTRQSANTDPIGTSQNDDIVVLRDMLFRDERELLHRLEVEISRVENNALPSSALAASVADILSESLDKARLDNKPALARALAPFIVSSIRREIVNSRDDMVEALYPITGRLVTSAVSDAFKRLMANLNGKLEVATSPNMIKARIKSSITRKPLSHYILSDDNSAEIVQIILIERQSGEVLGHYSKETSDGQSDVDLVGGMMSALNSFTSEAFKQSDTELRQIDLNGSKVALRQSAKRIIALQHSGSLTVAQGDVLDKWFTEHLENPPEPSVINVALEALSELLQNAVEPKSKSNVAPFLLLFLAVILIGYLGYGVFQKWSFTKQVNQIEMRIEQDNRLSMLQLQVKSSFDDRIVSVRGFIGNGSDQIRLMDIVDQQADSKLSFAYDLTPLQSLLDLDDFAEAQNQNITNVRDEITQLISAEISKRDERFDALAVQSSDLVTTLSNLDAKIEDQLQISQSFRANTEDTMTSASHELSTAKTVLESSKLQIASLEQTVVDLKIQIRSIELEKAALAESLIAFENLQRQTNINQSGQNERLLTSQSAIEQSITNEISNLRANIQSLNESAYERLRIWIANLTISFSDGTNLENPIASAAILSTLAAALEQYDINILVLGHSDKGGDDAINLAVSQSRAETVSQMLQEFGSSINRITVEARGTQNASSQIVGSTSPDRRVSFEIDKDL